MEQYMPFIWIGFAVIMAVFEAATTQLVSIWFVIGAVCAAVTTIFTPSIPIQSAVFIVVSLLALLLTRPVVRKLKKNKKTESTNADRLIGEVGTVIIDIENNITVGQVKVLGEIWSAKSDAAPLRKGENVKVLAIEGVKLIVEPNG